MAAVEMAATAAARPCCLDKAGALEEPGRAHKAEAPKEALAALVLANQEATEPQRATAAAADLQGTPGTPTSAERLRHLSSPFSSKDSSSLGNVSRETIVRFGSTAMAILLASLASQVAAAGTVSDPEVIDAVGDVDVHGAAPAPPQASTEVDIVKGWVEAKNQEVYVSIQLADLSNLEHYAKDPGFVVTYAMTFRTQPMPDGFQAAATLRTSYLAGNISSEWDFFTVDQEKRKYEAANGTADLRAGIVTIFFPLSRLNVSFQDYAKDFGVYAWSYFHPQGLQLGDEGASKANRTYKFSGMQGEPTIAVGNHSTTEPNQTTEESPARSSATSASGGGPLVVSVVLVVVAARRRGAP